MNTNIKISNLIINEDIVNYVGTLKVSWLARIIIKSLTEKLHKFKPIGSVTVGSPKMKWEGLASQDLKEMKLKYLEEDLERSKHSYLMWCLEIEVDDGNW